ncbi:MAG: DNA-processing protein DprA [Candidatus Kapabacteria bacterium]|nr:DNA-processing protein DprA [Candidatus Kapabacteria bacterium]
MNEELLYWFALTQLKNWGIFKKNQLIVKIITEQKITLSQFFNLKSDNYIENFNLDKSDIIDLDRVKKELPNLSFLLEDLLAQGYELITINSSKYSKTLKENLKLKYSPPLLFIKGNSQLLQEDSIAIVGSRDADEISLKFTDKIAEIASKEFKVIISGFAKGVDKQALDSAIKYNGHSIIVLPQGIMTFNSGFNKYYKEIQRGDVLVLSTFHPKAPWSVQLAMSRNPIIYGLAKGIYVAQSSDKGGTWSGVIDGINKGRKIFVRLPYTNEKNANNILIQKGAIPVDQGGNLIENKFNQLEFNDVPIINDDNKKEISTFDLSVNAQIEPKASIDDRIRDLLSYSELTSKEIIKTLNLDWKIQKMTSHLNKIPNIIKLTGKPSKFYLKGDKRINNLFGE